MLTSDLLRHRVKGGTIVLLLIDATATQHRNNAEHILGLWRQAHEAGHASNSRPNSTTGLGSSESTRCFAASPRCSTTAVNGARIRRSIPSLCDERFPHGEGERTPLWNQAPQRPTADDVLQTIAERHNVTSDDIAGALYADLKSEQRLIVLKEYAPTTPRALQRGPLPIAPVARDTDDDHADEPHRAENAAVVSLHQVSSTDAARAGATMS